jgi:hypothetical protein
MEFVTLNTIITDLLSVIRGSNVTRSEPISKRQLEAWVHQYRALLIKQDMDKGKMPNPDYIQEIPSLKIEVVDRTFGSSFLSETYLLRTELEIPKTIDLNFKSGFTYIGTMDGREIQFVPEGRVTWQQYKKYTNAYNLAFLRSERIYMYNTTPIQYITVRGIFEVPTEVSNFMNSYSNTTAATLDSPYPIPINILPTLKEMILKNELGIMAHAPTDNTDNTKHNVEQVIKQD